MLRSNSDVDAVEPDRAPTRNATGSSVTLAAKSAGVIVSKRLGSAYRAGRVEHWLKIKNPAAPTAKRKKIGAQSDGRDRGRPGVKNDQRHAVFDVRACPDHSGSVNNLACRLALDWQVMAERRFPPPWTFEEYRGISYIVHDANKLPVAYVYFESEPGRRAAANLMTKDEARKIANGIARLPELLMRPDAATAQRP